MPTVSHNTFAFSFLFQRYSYKRTLKGLIWGSDNSEELKIHKISSALALKSITGRFNLIARKICSTIERNL